jgi:two-component system, cell cycle sensor histidine kinase and response regulator CckA
MSDDAELERLRKRVAALEAESAARDDERAMLRTVVETMPAFVLRISLEGEIEFVNRVLPAYGERPLAGHSIYTFAAPDQHEVMRNALETVRRTGKVASFESIALAPDGTRDWYLTVVGPILHGDELVGLTLICSNVTRVKAAELALLESHERLAMALDAGNVGVWRWDSVHDHVEWDAKLCTMLGVEPDRAPRTRAEFLALASDDQRDALSEHIERALVSGIYLDFELRADLLAGTRWFILKGGAVRDASGAVVGLLGGVVDETLRKRLLLQVSEAQKLDALGQLSAGMAHNFNNMLATVIPALELAAREVRPPLTSLLEDAKETSLRSAELIKQLMLFSRRERPAQRRLESLETVLRRAIILCRGTFGPEITLSQRGVERAARVLVDGPQMEQTVLNLLLNARDALQVISGYNALIEITVEELPPPSRRGGAGELLLRVRDTGCGMDEATRARIFEPFFTTKAFGEGTGLGLSTAWATVRAHHGSLTCESTPGVGTSFSLVLPIDDAPASTTPPQGPPGAPGSGELVLLIDDDRSLRQTIAALLEQAGYRVLSAPCGEEGVRLFRQHPAAVVLLDHSMPGQPPADTLAQLRELAPTLPVISFSGLGASLADATAHLQKPVDSATLLDAIRAALA